ncbi:MAG: DUF4468 domain-containing protein [Cytophagales bacterium]|nr:DUF4468 domain-containing protein [Cytophagales bacterium]
MKTEFSLILLCLSFVTMAQLPTNEKGEVVFTNVVQAEGMSKDELYKNAKFWIISTLKSGDNMVELSGDNSDRIVGTGNMTLENIVMAKKYHRAKQNSLNFKFIVLCKEGRLKYEVSNFTYSYLYEFIDVPKETIVTGLENISKPQDFTNEKHILTFEESVHSAVKSKVEVLLQDFLETMAEFKSLIQLFG